MPLPAGARLGPYEIVAPLGAGGMGEVYRARDTRLERDVAIKVLREHLTAQADVRARFEREAKTVSGLGHPHICTLYDIGRHDDTDFLVMELVEGETLADRLARGPLPNLEVLRLGAQIAEALDRAHRAGVVHRDLKPGNIMLTRSGAKLMDFGLARSARPAVSTNGGSSALHAPIDPKTDDAPLTIEGTIVGTFQYMAPEQLEGKESDTRSDLWALGCVLYEMATGRRAFDGKSQASLISSIMTGEPQPITDLAPLAPPGLDRVVRTCLAKDPEERVQTAHDLKLQLQGLMEGSSQVAALPASARRAGRDAFDWKAAAIATVVVVGALAIVPFLTARFNAKTPIQLSLTPPENQRLAAYWSTTAMSPDGRMVAYVTSDSLQRMTTWIQSLDAPEPKPIPGIDNPMTIFWSPDSRYLGFSSAWSGKLSKIAVSGGSPVVLCDARSARGGSWSRGGEIIFAPTAQGPLYRVPASGGAPVQATWLDTSRHEVGHRFPSFLPDGDHFLFAALPGGADGFDTFVGSLSSRKVKRVLSAASAASYVEPGYLLFVRRGKVMAQRFDPGRLELTATPVELADAPARSVMTAEPIGSTSHNGRLVYLVANDLDTDLEWFDRGGASRGTLPLAPGKWKEVRLSPDERYAAVSDGDDIWRVDLARSVAVRLTANVGMYRVPVWSPDGSRIACMAGVSGPFELMIMNADGTGEPKTLPTTSDLFKWPEDWARDGILFHDDGGTTASDIWIAPTSGGRARPLIQTRFVEMDGRIAPDGRWIAYASNEAGMNDIYIQSYPVLGHKVRVSSGGGSSTPYWVAGGSELWFRGEGSDVMAVTLSRRGDELDVGPQRPMLHLPSGTLDLDVSRDGRRVLAIVPKGAREPGRLRVILDWTALVRR